MLNLYKNHMAKKPVNYIDKKTFRLGHSHLTNLERGSVLFNEDSSDYVRRVLSLPPALIKKLCDSLKSDSVTET